MIYRLVIFVLAGALISSSAQADGHLGLAESYSELVYRNYLDAHQSALMLQSAVESFLMDPSEGRLSVARQAWLFSRISYGQSEAFRFYEGPIDFVDDERGLEGPEGRLNAWPMAESYIDYVAGASRSGIIFDTVPLTRELIVNKNQANDEADVSTGYHAIEFLLWGQDLNSFGPGTRPAADYRPGDPVRERRGEYLRLVTELVVEDLAFLVDEWSPDRAGNYRARFVKMESGDVVARILTGLATLSGFELASERMGVPLDSGDQEDEHSCFSDNTHNDLIFNLLGIANVYRGSYGTYQGTGVSTLVREVNPKLDAAIEAKLDAAFSYLAALEVPLDQKVLATPTGSPARIRMEMAVTTLQELADLLKEAGRELGADVRIVM